MKGYNFGLNINNNNLDLYKFNRATADSNSSKIKSPASFYVPIKGKSYVSNGKYLTEKKINYRDNINPSLYSNMPNGKDDSNLTQLKDDVEKLKKKINKLNEFNIKINKNKRNTASKTPFQTNEINELTIADDINNKNNIGNYRKYSVGQKYQNPNNGNINIKQKKKKNNLSFNTGKNKDEINMNYNINLNRESVSNTNYKIFPKENIGNNFGVGYLPNLKKKLIPTQKSKYMDNKYNNKTNNFKKKKILKKEITLVHFIKNQDLLVTNLMKKIIISIYMMIQIQM